MGYVIAILILLTAGVGWLVIWGTGRNRDDETGRDL